MNDRDYKTWISAYIRVDAGRVVRETSAGAQDLIGKTLDEVSQWVLTDGGDIYPVGRLWHTCCDWPRDPCGACESPMSEPDAYGVVVRRTAPLAEPGGFLEMIDRVSAHLSPVAYINYSPDCRLGLCYPYQRQGSSEPSPSR